MKHITLQEDTEYLVKDILKQHNNPTYEAHLWKEGKKKCEKV
jgi:hypothetical protein